MRRERIKQFFLNKVDAQKKISVFEEFHKQIGLHDKKYDGKNEKVEKKL